MGNVAKDWRALALGFCTLWGNMLLLDTTGGAFHAVPFASRMASMAFSILGFVIAYLMVRARPNTPLRQRRILLAATALGACVGSFVHFAGFAGMPAWIDVTAVALFSVCFAFPLIACGEIYAELGAKRAVAYAGVSYLLAWLGCSLVGAMPEAAVCGVATVLPALTLIFVLQPRKGAHAPSEQSSGSADTAFTNTCSTLKAIPLPVLAALTITYFALGTTWAQAGNPQDYFGIDAVVAAVLTSVAVTLVCLALHGRVPLTGLYKALMVGQVLAAFLLSEWSAAAQVAVVITLVGVKIVAWTLMAELACGAQLRGVGPAALVYAAGCLAGHVGEGIAGVISAFGLVNQVALTIVVVALLVGAAAFLFTGSSGSTIATAENASDSAAGATGIGISPASASPAAGTATAPLDPAAVLDERISELARTYLLSERETDVFRLWATGHTLKYIQDKLYLSPSTVKTHVRHIYDKTGLHSRAEIVALLDNEEPTTAAGRS